MTERRVAVRGVMVLDGKLLCARLKPYNGPPSKSLGDFWSVLGGTLEPGETLVAGLERELIEETGIRPDIGNLLYVHQYSHGGGEHLEFFFHVLNAADYRAVDLSKTTHGATEIAELKFIDPAEHHVLPKFLCTEPLASLTADQPTKVFSYL